MLRGIASFGIRTLVLFLTISSVISAPLLRPHGQFNYDTGRCRSIATDGSNFLFASYSQIDSSIWAWLVGSEGEILGRVATGRIGAPPFAAFNGTNYLLAWTENAGTSTDLHGRFVSPNYAANTQSNQFLILSGISAQNLTGVTWDGRTFLTVWNSSSNGLSSVEAQLLCADGTPVGDVLQVSSPGAIATNSAAAAGANHVIVWMESTGATNEWHTRCRTVAADGSLSEIATLSSTPAFTSNPLTVSCGKTECMAVWNREVGPFTYNSDHTYCGGTNSVLTNNWLMLFARMFSPDGSPRNSEFQVTNMRGNQAEPQSAFDGTNYLITWNDSRLIVNSCIESQFPSAYAQRIGSDGTLVDFEFNAGYRMPWSRHSATALSFAGGQFVYAGYFFQGSHPAQWLSSTFLRPLVLGNGAFSNLKPLSNGIVQARFTGVRESGTFLPQLSTNLIDWSFIPGQNPAIFVWLPINQVSQWTDPLTNYAGPRFYRAVNPAESCISNLVVIEKIISVWAFEHNKGVWDRPLDSDLYGPDRYLPAPLKCPAGGIYWFGDLQTPPFCSLGTTVAQHSL